MLTPASGNARTPIHTRTLLPSRLGTMSCERALSQLSGITRGRVVAAVGGWGLGIIYNVHQPGRIGREKGGNCDDCREPESQRECETDRARKDYVCSTRCAARDYIAPQRQHSRQHVIRNVALQRYLSPKRVRARVRLKFALLWAVKCIQLIWPNFYIVTTTEMVYSTLKIPRFVGLFTSPALPQ